MPFLGKEKDVQMRKTLLVAVLLLPAQAAAAEGLAMVDPGLPAYTKTGGISGSISSVGSDTPNNLMTFLGRGVPERLPECENPDRGQGIGNRASRPDQRFRAAWSHVADDERGRGRRI